MNIEEAKKIQIVDYLARLGFQPERKSGVDYWYNSMLPGRNEKTPSFKVNVKKNVWKDWGGDNKDKGTIIDFGTKFHQCSIGDFLKKLDEGNIKFKQHVPPANKDEKESPKIIVTGVKELDSIVLLRYLESRRIPQHIARKYCKEVNYTLYGRNYFSIGFKNDAGGYALRNQVVKSASMPNGPTFIDNGAKQVVVFEGFFNFLSYMTLHHKQDMPNQNFLILNSGSFAEACLPKMQEHDSVLLYLDNDPTGDKKTAFLKAELKDKCADRRELYKNYKDLNAFHVEFGKHQHQRQQHRL